MILVILLELGAGIAFAVDKNTIVDGIARDFGRAIDNYDYVQTTLDAGNHIVVVQDRTSSNTTAGATLLINVLQTWVSITPPKQMCGETMIQ